MRKRRSLYRFDDLKRAIEPASVAIVGASPRPGAFGDRALRNLHEFAGSIHLVNARYEKIGDRRCYPSITELPIIPDCVIVTTNRDAVETVVEECARVGVGGVIIFASGFAETGQAQARADQQHLEEIVSDTRTRIIGPNCLGIVSYDHGVALTFSDYTRQKRHSGPRIGIVSQSGAIGFALAQAGERGVAISHVLTAGNSCDVDIADQVAFLADHPDCSSIACVFEGMEEPDRLLRAAEIAGSHGKPLIVHKLATGAAGATAAMSHTGSLAGSHAAYCAALERHGVVIVDDYDEVLETAAFFAKAPAPKAKGVAVISTSGGAAIMAADKAEAAGIALPQAGAAAQSIIDKELPGFSAAQNPFDLTGQILNNPDSLPAAAGALMADPGYGALVMPLVIAYDLATPRILAAGEAASRHGKLACIVWVSGWLEGPGAREAERDPHVAVFRSMRNCFATLAAWHRRDAWQSSLPRHVGRSSDVDVAQKVREAISAAAHPILSEREAKSLLTAYGIPVVPEELSTSPAGAVAAAERFGYPVALKIESSEIPHKSEVGGVKLNLSSADAVRAAFASICESAARLAPSARVSGVLVQPMIASGTEMLLGAKIDPQFGPLVVVGLGGVLVEIIRDTAITPAPVGRAEAHAMLRKLRGYDLLQGFRGREIANVEAIVDAICRFSEFLFDQKDLIVEAEINPLICSGRGAVAADALIYKG